MADIPVTMAKSMAELMKRPEATHFTVSEYHCILQRESTLREFASLVGGVVPILRFIYATETVDYEWYPQNPLERAKLDQFFDWFYLNRTQGNLIKKADLVQFETFFIGETQPYLIGMHEMTVVDLVAFFAIMPAHIDYFDGEEARRITPKM